MVPVHDILSIDGENITLIPGKSWYEFFTENDLEYSENFENSDSMDIWNQSLKPVIIMDQATFNKLEKRNLIVLLFDTLTNQYIWGELENGVQFTASTHLDRYTLNFTRQAITPIF